MKVLQVHNHYRAHGGEDTVMDLERELLISHGHHLERFTASNKELKASLRAGVETVWSQPSYRTLRERLRETAPDVLHVHNTFPQLSPSVYWAASAEGVPVVQTLHNYRLTCADASLLRDGEPCELCVGHPPWHGVLHRCYRGSAAASAAIAAMQTTHRALGTFANKVDAYITLTQFARSVMARSGLPEELMHVKPNFVPDTMPQATPERRSQVVFVGRLSKEKGADLLLEAWAKMRKSAETRLIVVGDGPERESLEKSFHGLPGLEWRGWLSHEEAMREVARSRCLVVPSRAYEGFPMVVVEAMSVGTPVIAPDHAAFPEILPASGAKLLFEPGDPEDLKDKITAASNFGDEEWLQLSRAARETYLDRYTAETNHERLMEVYEAAIERAERKRC